MKSPDIETAVRLYYEKTELTSSDIKALFDTKDTQTAKLKKQVKQRMAEKGVKSWLPKSVNTKVAFEVWGIEIEDFESRLKALRRLKLNSERT